MPQKIEIHSDTTVAINYCDENGAGCSDICIFRHDSTACIGSLCTSSVRDDRRSVYFTTPKFSTRALRTTTITKERMIELALDNGFKLKLQKDGSMALNSYVFDFVDAVLKEVQR